jgi:hypothetical protein
MTQLYDLEQPIMDCWISVQDDERTLKVFLKNE